MQFENFDITLRLIQPDRIESEAGSQTKVIGPISTALDTVIWNSKQELPVLNAVRELLVDNGSPLARGRLATALGQALLPGQIGKIFKQRVAARESVGAAIRLRIATDDAIAFVPWELATLDGIPLAAHPSVSMTRWDPRVSNVDDNQLVEAELTITMVDLLAGRGSESDSWASISREFTELTNEILDRPPLLRPTFAEIGGLAGSILHITGHGVAAPDSADGKPQIKWTGGDGRSDYVDADVFASSLQAAGLKTNLVVLEACSTAASTTRTGFGARLLLHGVRATIASTADVVRGGADRFFGRFYDELAVTGSLDQAMMAARLAGLSDRRGAVQWWAHALYCNEPDNTTFATPRHRPGTASSNLERSHTWLHYLWTSESLAGSQPARVRRLRVEALSESAGPTWRPVENFTSALSGEERRSESMVMRACSTGRVLGYVDSTKLHLFALNLHPSSVDGDSWISRLGDDPVRLPAALCGARLLAVRASTGVGSNEVIALLRSPTALCPLRIDIAAGVCRELPPIPGRFRAAALGRRVLLAVKSDQRLLVFGDGPLATQARSLEASEFLDLDLCESPAGGPACAALLTQSSIVRVTSSAITSPVEFDGNPLGVQLVRQGRVTRPTAAVVWFADSTPRVFEGFYDVPRSA